MAVTDAQVPGATAGLYAKLEERVMARDQVGASRVFYDLVKADRPITEMIGELVRIHAPYTHVPYHQRLDDGVVKFVNNDHCLLSSAATLRLMKFMPANLQFLPFAQTVWYVPSGLDPWNQLLGKAPGHYVRFYDIKAEDAGPPEAHWADQDPIYEEGPFQERLNNWLTLVQRGEVLQSYGVFLGLLEDEANRPRLLAQLMFAGLIDVQDRMLLNRSYTTGHKSYRARATIELGNAIGWDKAHSVAYAGVPDIAVGPRWYSTFEMACNVTQQFLDGKDADLIRNQEPLTPEEAATLRQVVREERDPVWTYYLTDLLKAGKGPRQIVDELQIANADTILDTGKEPNAYSMPQHASEYLNHLRWFYDTFSHPHQVKLLYVAANFVNQAAHHQCHTPGNMNEEIREPAGAGKLTQAQLLRRVDEAVSGQDPDESVGLTAAYLRGSFDREPLAALMALTASKVGNDPHNQEIAICLVEDYFKNASPDRDRLLLAAAKHTAGHRKYGDPSEAFRRFVEGVGIDAGDTAVPAGPRA